MVHYPLYTHNLSLVGVCVKRIGKLAIKETYRILQLEGIFRLVVPDLVILASRYLDRINRGEPDANSRFLQEAYLGMESRPNSMISRFVRTLGNSKHLWMWDEKSLSNELSKAGFVDVRRAQFNDGSDPMFRLVEEEGRFEDAVAIEARRPRY